ncbi:MAG: hypothetical protein JWN29_1384, partial [Acidimicrobiales bacterium]|nr:hypothetical protein [Acidimicrobiales bacterium]
GRRRRIVPDKMRLRLRQRDRHCAWPGCDRTRAVKAHHLTHWTAEGETEEDNCVLLCPRHHALAHEGGWTITGSATERTLRFERPTCGTAIPTAPTATPTDLLTRFGLYAA